MCIRDSIQGGVMRPTFFHIPTYGNAAANHRSKATSKAFSVAQQTKSLANLFHCGTTALSILAHNDSSVSSSFVPLCHTREQAHKHRRSWMLLLIPLCFAYDPWSRDPPYLMSLCAARAIGRSYLTRSHPLPSVLRSLTRSFPATLFLSQVKCRVLFSPSRWKDVTIWAFRLYTLRHLRDKSILTLRKERKASLL